MFVGVGVGGTLGVQYATDDESKSCTIARDWADEYIGVVKRTPGQLSDDQWLKTLDILNGLLNIRDKFCR